MKISIKSVLTFALSCVFAIVTFFISADSSMAASAQCYWMESSPPYSWVPAPQGNISKQECYNLDSCGGGLGQSGGGCYKWAISSDSPGTPWK